MDADRAGWVPLPESGDTDRAERAGIQRDTIGRARRVSNWTAAALIAGTGAAALALAHQAFPATAPASGTVASGAVASGAGTGSAASTRGASGPTVTHSVATTSASGVTTITTTRTVNGKTTVTQVRNAPAHGDN